MTEQFIEPGLTIHYHDINKKGSPVVLLLHGLGATCESWQLQTPALVDQGFRVIVPDMRGFGKSTYPGGNNSPEIMAGDVSRLIDKLELGKIHLVGISLGGTVALEFVIAKPELVKSLVITNSFAKLRPRNLSLWVFYLVRLFLVHLIGIETQAQYVADRLFPEPDEELQRNTFKDQVCQSNPQGYRSTMRSLAFFDISSDVRKIRNPTLVITGDRDTVVPPESQTELAHLIPSADQKFIEGAGHAVIVEKPGEYNQLLTEFILVYS